MKKIIHDKIFLNITVLFRGRARKCHQRTESSPTPLATHLLLSSHFTWWWFSRSGCELVFTSKPLTIFSILFNSLAVDPLSATGDVGLLSRVGEPRVGDVVTAGGGVETGCSDGLVVPGVTVSKAEPRGEPPTNEGGATGKV